MNFLQKLLSASVWPFKQIDKATSQLVAEKAEVGTQAVLDTLPPVVRSLLNGEEVTISLKIQLKAE